ncbi:hypothetical protein [Rhizorhabdus argentea]|uniref:hypothetical protein n=1 Tax=Rhizorhabdus argentea TaxID=1387174 RepID=UPI0030EED968
MFGEVGVAPPLRDERESETSVATSFLGELTAEGEAAVANLLERGRNGKSPSPGSGWGFYAFVGCGDRI